MCIIMEMTTLYDWCWFPSGALNVSKTRYKQASANGDNICGHGRTDRLTDGRRRTCSDGVTRPDGNGNQTRYDCTPQTRKHTSDRGILKYDGRSGNGGYPEGGGRRRRRRLNDAYYRPGLTIRRYANALCVDYTNTFRYRSQFNSFV